MCESKGLVNVCEPNDSRPVHLKPPAHTHETSNFFSVFSQLTAIFLWAKIVRVSLFVEHEFNYISGFNNHD